MEMENVEVETGQRASGNGHDFHLLHGPSSEPPMTILYLVFFFTEFALFNSGIQRDLQSLTQGGAVDDSDAADASEDDPTPHGNNGQAAHGHGHTMPPGARLQRQVRAFTGFFYRVFLGITEEHVVCMGFPRLCINTNRTGFLPRFTGFNLVFVSFTRFDRV